MKRSDSSSPSEREAIEATAAAWLAQRDDGLSPAQAADFARWRAADRRHEAAVARLEDTWSALQQLRDFRPEARIHPDRDLLANRRRTGRVVPFPAIASAALAASLVFAAVWWFGATPPAAMIDEQRYATNADAYQRVALSDGSLVELDAQSEVAVRFTAGQRQVRLLRGHAHFTVTKDPVRPFSVEAGVVAVRAVGTAFSVRLGAGDIEVLVTEGTVEVGQPAAAIRSSRGNGAGTRGSRPGVVIPAATPLVAGERALIQPTVDLPTIERLSAEAVRDALAWRGPWLVFADTPLADAAARFNQYNRIQLELGDDALRALPVGGSFRADNVEAFVRLLALDSEITADRVAPDRFVLRRAR